MANERKMIAIESNIQKWLQQNGKDENCPACVKQGNTSIAKLCLAHEVESDYAEYCKLKDRLLEKYFRLLADIK
jgi:hypothetical protein